MAGLTALTMPYGGWGSKFVDYDNEGWKDLFVAQGHVMDTISADFPSLSYKQPLLLLRNDHGRSKDDTARGGVAFQIPLAARGAAFGDSKRPTCMSLVVVLLNVLARIACCAFSFSSRARFNSAAASFALPVFCNTRPRL